MWGCLKANGMHDEVLIALTFLNVIVWEHGGDAWLRESIVWGGYLWVFTETDLKNGMIRELRLVSKFMMSLTGKQIITIHNIRAANNFQNLTDIMSDRERIPSDIYKNQSDIILVSFLQIC